MKNLIIIFILSFFAISCEVDNVAPSASDVGGNVSPKTQITRIDTDYEIPIVVFTKSGVSLTSAEIYKDNRENPANVESAIILGDKVADATIATDKASFNSNSLGNFNEFKDPAKFYLAIVSTFSNGTKTTIPYTLNVVNAITWTDKKYNTTTSPGVTTIKLKDPTDVFLSYKVISSTKIESLKLEISKNEGTFTEVAANGYDATKKTGQINLNTYTTDPSYNADDKLVFRFTAAKGTQTSVLKTEIKIITQDYTYQSAGALSADKSKNKFNLKTSTVYPDIDTKNAEIVFDGVVLKAEGTTPIEFYVGTGADYEADLFNAQSKTYSTTPIAIADLGYDATKSILYKITRKEGEGNDAKEVIYYGAISIANGSGSEPGYFFNFNYKEGTVLEK